MFNIMAYNYYGPWSAYTGQNAPLFESSIESNYEKTNLNVAVSIKNWINAGSTQLKLNVGLAFYGRAFTLVSEDDHGLHAPIIGAGTVPTPTFRVVRLTLYTVINPLYFTSLFMPRAYLLVLSQLH